VPYRIEYTPAAARAIRKLLPKSIVESSARIEILATHPRGPGSVKLTGHDAYRIRIGDYRVNYGILDDKLLILIIDIGHRRDVYRDR
jgi:mRNA interferase RelE/StbE